MPEDPALLAQLREQCVEEGLPIMADVFKIILARDELTVEQVVRFLAATGPMRCYEDFIVPGIDNLSDAISDRTEPPAVYYATSEHDRDDLPWPLPADAWFWQTGNRWVAVYSEFHPDWWEGADPEDIAARPTPWRRPINDVPSTGTLVYNDANGALNTTERGVQ